MEIAFLKINILLLCVVRSRYVAVLVSSVINTILFLALKGSMTVWSCHYCDLPTCWAGYKSHQVYYPSVYTCIFGWEFKSV